MCREIVLVPSGLTPEEFPLGALTGGGTTFVMAEAVFVCGDIEVLAGEEAHACPGGAPLCVAL